MPIETGTRLGPYEVLEPLGSGGMGEVYLARDTRLGRDVAVKVLPENLSGNPDALDRFEKEVKALAALSHPNIVTIYDIGEEQGTRYAVMEYLEGETLRNRMKRQALTWEEAAQIGVEIVQGLAAAHSKGVIHRDLKPENIILTSDARVKVLDFGLAHWAPVVPAGDVEDMPTQAMPTRTGMLMGTIHYMSPEQVRGTEIDERSDVFSFGCILYEMVNRRLPFPGMNPADAMASILKDSPAESVGPIPVALERVIQRCLQKDPARRYQSARDLLAALRRARTAPVPTEKPARSRRNRIRSIAILPFMNTVADPELEYLSDGLTESIINSLSALPELKVMASTTVFRFKGKDLDPRAVGKDLNVRSVLSGRLTVRGESLNLQMELIDTKDGSLIWSDRSQRELRDLVTIQQEIACQISEKLRPKLIGKDKERIAKRPTENSEAYNLYLKGRYHWNKRTDLGFRKAVEFFEQAIQEDPTYAPAYAGLADCYSLLGGFGYLASSDAYPLAKAAARQALELDSSLAEAHTTLAVITERYDWNWAAAEEQYQSAIRFNPGYASAHQWYGGFLLMLGRFEESYEETRKATELDPLSMAIQCDMAYFYFLSRQYDLASQQHQRILDMDPNFLRARVDLGLVLAHKGEHERAIAEIERGLALSPQSPDVKASLAYACAMAGDRERTMKLIAELQELCKERYVSPFAYAVIYASLRETDRAFEYLYQAFAERQNSLVSLKVNPRLDNLRHDPRFDDLIRRVGLPL